MHPGASGWCSTLAGRDLNPPGAHREVSACPTWHPPRPGFAWRTDTRTYRSLQNVIDEGVIVLVDVTDLRRAQERLSRLAAIVESSQDAIIGVGLDSTISTSGPPGIWGPRKLQLSCAASATLTTGKSGC